MVETTEKPNPCHMCGQEEPVILTPTKNDRPRRHPRNTYRVVCAACPCGGPAARDEHTAICLWNTSEIDSPQMDELAELMREHFPLVKEPEPLKSCPFCGSSDTQPQKPDMKGKQPILCHECGAHGPNAWHKGNAHQYWNERDPQPLYLDDVIEWLTNHITSETAKFERQFPLGETKDDSLDYSDPKVMAKFPPHIRAWQAEQVRIFGGRDSEQ